MFGIGFTEILLISIIAILFLGPDKLPGALVDMAKFIKSVKKTVSEAKGSLEEEMKIADLKEEALGYKKQLTDATAELKGFKNLSFDDFDDESYDDEVSTKSASEMAKQATKKEPEKESIETIAKESNEKESNENISTTLAKNNNAIATQIEAKNETVTFKKLPKKEKLDSEGKA